MPRYFVNTKYPEAKKAILFLQMVASYKQQQGEILNHLFFE